MPERPLASAAMMRYSRNHFAPALKFWRNSYIGIFLCSVDRPPSDGHALFDSQRTHHMKILIASTPRTGHVNPMLAITHILMADGNEVAFYTGSVFGARVQASGAKFFSLPVAADFSTPKPAKAFAELSG